MAAPGTMTTPLSDDGRSYWDGSQWRPALSADGRWRWDGTQWIPQEKPPALQGGKFRIGSWVAAGAAGLFVLFCLLAVVMAIVESAQGSGQAPGSIGLALMFLSLATLLAAPLGIRIAIRRRIAVVASVISGVVFLASCGGGFALVAANPA